MVKLNMNNYSKYILLFFIAQMFQPAIAGLTSAKIEISSTFNPVGSGARALGMGGAFIAIADDATAASWNPGGLIQLRKPEFAVVGHFKSKDENLDFTNLPEAKSHQTIDYKDLNYLSLSYPCAAQHCGKNMIFSLNYQNLYEFDKKIVQNFGYELNSSFFKGSEFNQFNYQQTGNIYALGLAYAVQIQENISLGFSMNFWGDYLFDNGWEKNYETTLTTAIDYGAQYDNDADRYSTIISQEWRREKNRFEGVNVNLGVLWNVYENEEKKITLGAVYKTPFHADVKRSVYRITEFTQDNLSIDNPPTKERQNEDYYMPASYGVGIAYQHSDALTISGDIYQTQWQKFIRTDQDGYKTVAFGVTPQNESQVKATTQFRLGVEHRLINQDFDKNYILPIRAGIFYDPIPAQGKADDVYGVSLGGGIAYQHFVFDMAYQFRFGNHLNENSDQFQGDGITQKLREHSLYFSMFYRF